MIIHALYILKIYFQVVRIDFALNYVFNKTKSISRRPILHKLTFAGLYSELTLKINHLLLKHFLIIIFT